MKGRKGSIIGLTAVLSLLIAAVGFGYDTFIISGTVLKPDGTPAANYQVKATNLNRTMTLDEGVTPVSTTDEKGEYVMTLSGETVVEVGDTFRVEAIDPATGDVVGYAERSVTSEDFELQLAGLRIGSITVEVKLAGITVQAQPKQLKAGVDAKADLSITVVDAAGNPITDDIVTLRIIEGTGQVTPQAQFKDGVYAAVYTPPTPALVGTVKIEVTSQKLGQSVATSLQIVPGPASQVIVQPEKRKLPVPEAGETAETDISIKVLDSEGNLVTDETVTVSARLPDESTAYLGQAQVQPDGTYGITFSTSITTVGIVLIEAVTSAGVKGSAQITLTAQAPAAVEVTAQPVELTAGSAETARISAVVKDKFGNPVPDEKVRFELVSDLASPGTLSVSEATTDAEGRCQVGYTPGETAGAVKVRATAVSTGAYDEAELTVKPAQAAEIAVQILPETGIVADGSQRATVIVTVKDRFGNVVTDETVKLAVKEGQGTVTEQATYDEARGAYIGTYTSPPTLQEGEETIVATAQKAGISAEGKVKLLAAPPESTPLLTIAGTVYYADGVTPAPEGWLVKVENLRLGPEDYLTPPEPVETDENGRYNIVLLAVENVAQTGDVIQATVTVGVDGEEVFRGTRTLTVEEIRAAQVSWDLVTSKTVSTQVFSVSGTVYYTDGTIAPGWKVRITNRDVPVLTAEVESNGDGRYDHVFQVTEEGKIAAETNNVFEITVAHPKTSEVMGRAEHAVTTAEVLGEHAEINVTLNALRALRVTGTVFESDGVTPAAGLPVVVRNLTAEERGREPMIPAEGETEDNGKFEVVIVDDNFLAAAEGDLLRIEVKREGMVAGVAEHVVTSDDLARGKVQVNITLGGLIVTAAIFEGDGKTLLPDGLAQAIISIAGKPDLTLTVPVKGGAVRAVYDTEQAKLIEAGDELSLKVVSAKDPTKLYADEVKRAITEEDKARVILDLDGIVTYRTSRFEISGVITDVAGNPVEGVVVTDVKRGISATTGPDGRYKLLYTDYDTNPTEGEEIQLKVTYKGFSRLILTAASLAERGIAVDSQILPVTVGGLAVNSSYYTRSLLKLAGDLTSGIPGLGQFVPLMVVELLSKGYYFDPFTGEKRYVITPPLLPTFPDGPQIFKDIAGLDMESFGNAVLPSPLGGVLDPAVLKGLKGVDSKIAGSKLDLYIKVPYPGVEAVEPKLAGITTVSPISIEKVDQGGEFTYQFQLDEKLALLVLPWWPGSDLAKGPAFKSVTLYYAEADEGSLEAPVGRDEYLWVPMTPEKVGDTYVWKADVNLQPGKRYYYFYEVTISPAIKAPFIEMNIYKWSMPDPRNLQFDDRGIISRLVDAIKPEFTSIISEEVAKYGADFLKKLGTDPVYLQSLMGRIAQATQPKVMEVVGGIISQMRQESDPLIVSFLTVPSVPENGSLWVAHFDISPNVVYDGEYELKITLRGAGGIVEEIRGKRLILDRSAASPEGITIALEPGRNAGFYRREDGVYVAAAKEEVATVRLTARYVTTDAVGALIQVLNYSEDPTEQASMPWLPANIEFVIGYALTQGYISEELIKELIENPTIDTLRKVAEELLAKKDQIWEGLRKLDPNAIAAIEKELTPQDRAALKRIEELLGKLLAGQLTADDVMEVIRSGIFANLQKMLGMLTYFSISPLQLGPTGIYSTEVLLPIEGRFWLRVVPFDDILNMEVTGPVVRLDVVPWVPDVVQIVEPAEGTKLSPGELTIKYRMVKRTGHPIISAVLQYAIVPLDGGELEWKDAVPLDPAALTQMKEGDEGQVKWVVDYDLLRSPSMQVALRIKVVNAIDAESAVPATYPLAFRAEIVRIETQDDEGNFFEVQPDKEGVYWVAALARVTAKVEATPGSYEKVFLVVSREGAKVAEIEFEEDLGGGLFRTTADTKELPNGLYAIHAEARDEQGNVVTDIMPEKTVRIANVVNLEGKPIELADIINTLTNGKPVERTLDAPKPVGGLVEFKVKAFFVKRAVMEVTDEQGKLVTTVAGEVSELPDELGLKEVTFSWNTDRLNGVYLLTFKLWGSPPVVVGPVKITVDNTPPAVAFEAPTPGSTTTTLPLVWASYSDASGVKRATFELINPAGETTKLEFTPGDEPITGSNEVKGDEAHLLTVEPNRAIYKAMVPLTDGVYKARMTVEDLAGNESAATVKFVVGEEKPPVVTEFGPEGIVTAPRPTIYLAFTDDFSGVEEVTIKLDGTELAVEMTETSATATPDSDLKPGLHEVEATLTDRAGKSTRVKWQFTVKLDTAGPVVTAYSPVGTVRTAEPTIIVSFADESKVAKAEFEVAGQTHEVENPENTASFKPAPLAEGEVVVKVRLTDEFGNASTVEWSFTVDLDTEPPLVTAYSPTDVVYTDSPTVTVSFADESKVVKVEFDVAGKKHTATPNSPAGSASFKAAGLSQGEAPVKVMLTDEAGNSATVEWSFTVMPDTTPPVLTAMAPQGVISNLRPTVTAAYSDDLSGVDIGSVALYLDGSKVNATATATGLSYTPTSPLEEGDHAVKLELADKAGNKASYEWSFTVQIDVVPPAVTFTSPVDLIGDPKPTIRVAYTDDKSGVDESSVALYLDGKKVSAEVTAAQATYTPQAPISVGEHKVKVELADKVGNKASYEWSFKVEDNPPTITSYSPADGEFVRPRTPIVICYQDDLAGVDVDSVKVYLDGKDVTAELKKDASRAAYVPKEELALGEHKVKVELADKVGNKAEREWSFYVEAEGLRIASPKAYPNPFDPTRGKARIEFQLTRSAVVTVKIYDFSLRLVRTLADGEEMIPGMVSFEWDGTTDDGDPLARGVYFCQITVKSGTDEPKATVLRIALYR